MPVDPKKPFCPEGGAGVCVFFPGFEGLFRNFGGFSECVLQTKPILAIIKRRKEAVFSTSKNTNNPTDDSKNKKTNILHLYKTVVFRVRTLVVVVVVVVVVVAVVVAISQTVWGSAGNLLLVVLVVKVLLVVLGVGRVVGGEVGAVEVREVVEVVEVVVVVVQLVLVRCRR